MRARTRHPRLVAAACRIYGVAIRLYPADFVRAFGHELNVTFRNRVEDVVADGGVLDWLAFSGHIALDWIRTCSSLVAEREAPGPGSLLGLSAGDAALGRIDRTRVDVSLVFAATGVVLACVGWYGFIAYLLSFVR
jgi:hypothetical protein